MISPCDRKGRELSLMRSAGDGHHIRFLFFGEFSKFLDSIFLSQKSEIHYGGQSNDHPKMSTSRSGRRHFADMIELRSSRWEECLGFSRWV